MLVPVLVTPASVPVVTVDEAKINMRVDHAEDEAFIQALISAATSHIEGWDGAYGLALLEQTWSQAFDEFDDELRLAVGKAISITSVTYYDSSNVSTALDLDGLSLFHDHCGPFIAGIPNYTWPSSYTRRDAVTVVYKAGFGTIASQVPAAIRQAVKLMVGHWYEHRETTRDGALDEVPLGARCLLWPYNRMRI